MPEPITSTTFGIAIATWAADKGVTLLGVKLWAFFSKSDFKRRLDYALRKDSNLVEVCDPPPTFDHNRLNQENWNLILEKVLTEDYEGLGSLLFDEQLIDYVWVNKENPPPTYDIGNCAARVTSEVITQLILSDEQLHREFELFVAKHFSAEHREIMAVLVALNMAFQQLTETLEQQNEEQKARDFEQSAKLDRILTAVEEPSLSRLNDGAEDVLLERELGELLDEKGKAIWQEIRDELRDWNYRRAHMLAKELKIWLAKQGKRASPIVRGRAYLMLTNLAFVNHNGSYLGLHAIPHARKLYDKAIKEYGGNPDSKERALLARCNAKLLTIEFDSDTGTKEIASFDDPDTILLHISILIDADKYEDAYNVFKDRDYQKEWIHEGIVALLHTDRIKQALRALEWACSNCNRQVIERCKLNYAKNILLIAALENEKLLPPPWLITDSHREVIESASKVLGQVIEAIRLENKVESGVQAEIIAVAYACHRTLGSIEPARSIIELLSRWQPVHEAYARAALRGDAPCTAELASRLRDDYPEDVQLQILAIDVDWESGREVNDIAKTLSELLHLDVRESDKKMIARFAFQAATVKEGLSSTDKNILEQLCGKNPITKVCFSAYDLLNQGRLDDASKELSAPGIDDDFMAKQLLADITIRNGNLEDGVKLLIAVGKELVEPYCLRKASFYAKKNGDISTAITCLQDSLLLDPDNEPALEDLAIMRARIGDSLTASELYRKLSEVAPNQPQYRLNQAYCLLNANEPEQAIEVLDALCDLESPALEAICAKAQILKDIGQPKDALKLLKQYKNQSWQDPRYLLMLMQIAFAANEDQQGNAALQQLNVLRESNEVARSLLQPHTLEDLVSYAKNQKSFLKEVGTQLLQGKIPWLLFERLKNNSPAWGWFARTQSLNWLTEDRFGYSNYALYASNGYHVLIDENCTKSVLPIKCAPIGSEVVFDITSILTLNRLGLLDDALSYFNKLYVPSSYLGAVVADCAQLLPHQPSQIEELLIIRDFVKKGYVQLLDPEQADLDTQLLDEYDDQNTECFRVNDLCSVVEGLEPDESLRPARESDQEISRDQPIVANLGTLRLLVKTGMLDSILSQLQIKIIRSTFQQIQDEIIYYESRKEVRKWCLELWESLKSNDKIEFQAVTANQSIPTESDLEGDQQEELYENIYIVMDALELAGELDIPLVVDDRFCQAVRLNSKPDQHHASFGTAQVVAELGNVGKITDRRAAEALLQLIKWRYRFIILDPTILRSIHDHFGMTEMSNVARYVQSCMRDIGLFSGPEAADIPVPMAFRVYRDWERNIISFVTSFWTDMSVTIEDARQITEWALTELLPTIPENLSGDASLFASFVPKTVLAQAMFDIFQLTDFSRGHECLSSIANSLGITDDEYLCITSEIIGEDYGN